MRSIASGVCRPGRCCAQTACAALEVHAPRGEAPRTFPRKPRLLQSDMSVAWPREAICPFAVILLAHRLAATLPVICPFLSINGPHLACLSRGRKVRRTPDTPCGTVQLDRMPKRSVGQELLEYVAPEVRTRATRSGP